MTQHASIAFVKRAVDPLRRMLRRAIGAPGGVPYVVTIETLRSDTAQLRDDVMAVAEGAAQADDRIADLIEELSAAIAESAVQRDALATEVRELERRVVDIEGALALLMPNIGHGQTDARSELAAPTAPGDSRLNLPDRGS